MSAVHQPGCCDATCAEVYDDAFPTFVCAGCGREVGLCFGCGDEFVDFCDNCAAPMIASHCEV